jgi:hypothetical protein
MQTPTTFEPGDRVRVAGLGTVVTVDQGTRSPGTLIVAWDDEPTHTYAYEPTELERVYE